jgi:adenylate kinase
MLKRFPQLSSISSGDLLRDNVRRKTALGRTDRVSTIIIRLIHNAGLQAESIMKTGALIPDSTILRLITSELTTRGWIKTPKSQKPLTLNSMGASLNPMDSVTAGADDIDNYITSEPSKDVKYDYSDSPDASFILDGFPRTAAQADQLDAFFPINLVVELKTPVSVILDRICNRWTHPASGRVYNTTFNAPKVDGKDDVTGEPLVQRDDDNPETWRARLSKFEETSKPLLDHYDKLGVLWRVEGNSSDEISPKLFEEFGRRFAA